MTKAQFLLLKLMEECCEVGQRASKQIQFGALERQNTVSLKTEKDNAERLKDEVVDLLCLIHLLGQENEIPRLSQNEFEERLEVKKKKLQKYLDYSYELGQLPKITL